MCKIIRKLAHVRLKNTLAGFIIQSILWCLVHGNAHGKSYETACEAIVFLWVRLWQDQSRQWLSKEECKVTLKFGLKKVSKRYAYRTS